MLHVCQQRAAAGGVAVSSEALACSPASQLRIQAGATRRACASPPSRLPAVLARGPSEELARTASRACAGPVSRLLAAFPCRDGKPRVRWPTLTYVLTPTLYNLQGRQAARVLVHPYLYQAHHLHCTCCAGTASRACAGPTFSTWSPWAGRRAGVESPPSTCTPLR